MTKEELVNKLIELHRQTISDANRVLEALIEYMTSEETEVVNTLIERLIKAEEHQETNFDHYIKTYFLTMYDNEVTFKLKDGWKESFNDFWRGDFREWIKASYEDPPKPKYKLSKFEYDLLDSCHVYTHGIKDSWTLGGMVDKGYFKDIPNDIPIKDILDNCEVVD